VNQRKDDARAEEYYLKALAADPNHANNLGNYASFLKNQRKDDARAEEYYLKAIAAEPNHANTLGNYASFLKNQRKDDARAEEYYLKALAADPNHANNLNNYVQFLIGCGRFDEAAPLANRAWALLSDQNENNMGVGEVAFSRWLLAAVTGKSGQSALGRLKTLLLAGYQRSPWSSEGMLATCLPKLVGEQGKLARMLAAAILDESRVSELSGVPTWELVQAIPLNAPWLDQAES
jgi:tetratricopeptide (TPR) repeat protein